MQIEVTSDVVVILVICFIVIPDFDSIVTASIVDPIKPGISIVNIPMPIVRIEIAATVIIPTIASIIIVVVILHCIVFTEPHRIKTLPPGPPLRPGGVTKICDFGQEGVTKICEKGATSRVGRLQPLSRVRSSP